MKICRSIEEMRAACGELRKAGRCLGFVPTMGALHDGHLSLVRAAKNSCDAVVVSIFVNPTQFGPNEDLATYPQTFDRDRELLEKEGLDLLFAPSAEEVYPRGGGITWVTVEGLSDKLDGRSRPGHFRGVTSIIAKLFHVIKPDVAFFGQKDAAQVAVIRQMVRNLNFAVEVVACPIVRERDGLAMSSRNRYLGPVERKQALVLHRSLMRVKELWEAGENDATRLAAAGKDEIKKEPGVRLDYFEIVNPDTLDAISTASDGSLVAVAAFVGSTRLIDNILLQLASEL
jgi:pantoate--beta-alanine ligase